MTIDVGTALAAIAAANDVDTLEKALQDASFIDATPGDDRQKYRGALGVPARIVRALAGLHRPRTGHVVDPHLLHTCIRPGSRTLQSSLLAAGKAKLRKLKTEQAAKGGAASATSKPAEKSPHAKEVREGGRNCFRRIPGMMSWSDNIPSCQSRTELRRLRVREPGGEV